MSDTLGFAVGDRQFAIPAAIVREVISVPPMARVPGAPPPILGAANVRGKIVPIMAVSRLLGTQDAEIGRIIVTDLNGSVGLAVTSVSQLVSHDEAATFDAFDAETLIAQAMPAPRVRKSTPHDTKLQDAAGPLAEAIDLLTFTSSGQDFALPLAATEQVLHLPPDITKLPHADPVIVGTIGWNDAVLPLLSLAALLAMPIALETPRARIVVVRIGSQRVGMVVDAMKGIVTVPESAIDPLPRVLSRSGAEARVQAICRLDGGTKLLSILAPEQLVREDITASLLASGVEYAATERSKRVAEKSERIVLFETGGELFGLPIETVIEVTGLPVRISRLPKAPDFLRGMMNLRGKAMPLIEMASRFQGKPRHHSKSHVIVVRMGDLTAGLIVDEVSEIVAIPVSAMRVAPDLGTQGAREFDRVATLQTSDKPVLVVDPAELLDRAERDLLRQFSKTIAKEVS